MNFILALLVVGLSLLAPWWVILIGFFLVGIFTRVSWKSAIGIALCVAILNTFIAVYFDYQAQGLISQRVSGVFYAPPWASLALPGAIGAWMSLFATRFGSAVCALIRKS
jgi:hypothetical protein